MNKIKLVKVENIKDRKPLHQQLNGLDLVLIRYDDKVSAFYGRCLTEVTSYGTRCINRKIHNLKNINGNDRIFKIY